MKQTIKNFNNLIKNTIFNVQNKTNNKSRISKFNNLKVFAINVGQEDVLKAKTFFKELNINNLEIYYDPLVALTKKFKLRGVPTTILFNKEGKEFARILGSIDFNDKKFIKWLTLYN